MAAQDSDPSRRNMCASCQNVISGKMITAMGRPWHFEHFVCAKCSCELGTINFYEREGAPYCEGCYKTTFAPKCAKCGQAVLERCITALDRSWHPEHFVCAKCQSTFDEKQGFNEREGQPYCSTCFHEFFGLRCFGCNQAITSNYLSALNAHWHPQCFVCETCHKDFSSGSFFEHEGRPYCQQHYHAAKGSLCGGCQQPIVGRCLTAHGRKFHPEHFRCSFCNNELSQGSFKENDGKSYCHDCFGKLFG